MSVNAVVRKTGRTWGVFVGSKLVEGGFFSRVAAEDAAREWSAGVR